MLKWKIFIIIIFGGGFSLMQILPVFGSEITIDTSSPFLHPDFTKKISMDFQEAALADVLKIFSQQSGLNLITSENIANNKVTVYLDNVPVNQALEQILRANNLTYELQPETDIYIVKPLLQPEVALITRVYHLKHASVNSAKIRKTLEFEDIESEEDDEDTGIFSVIEGLLTPRGQIIEDPRTNSLIITDIASNFPMIETTIAKMDVPVPQILIEVEILEVAKEISDKIGVKISEIPVVFTGAVRQHYYPWNQSTVMDKGYGDPIEYTAGTIDTSGFSATLNFLKTHTDTKTLARPRIMTLNNEPAEIKISTDEAIGITSQTQSSQSTATSSVEAERVETGVFLTVTPQANLASGEITMAIDPKVIVARTGSTFSGTTYRDPEERGSKAILRVQDGDTIIMGGLLREETSNTITKVPILGDIPFLGKAFRHKNESVTERELIIFITPHIINEIPVPKTAIISPQKIRREREQDIPLQKFREVDQELSIRIKDDM